MDPRAIFDNAKDVGCQLNRCVWIVWLRCQLVRCQLADRELRKLGCIRIGKKSLN